MVLVHKQINVTRQSFVWRVLTDRANRWHCPELFRAKEELRIGASAKGHQLSKQRGTDSKGNRRQQRAPV